MSAPTRIVLLLALGLGALACEEGEAPSDAASAGDTTLQPGADAAGPDVAWPEAGIEVGAEACCLAISGARVLWVDGGDIWLYDGSTGDVRALVGGDADQTDPTLDGDRVVWSDDRNGDYDLYTLTLGAGEAPEALVEAPGDQRQASLDAEWLVWVDRSPPAGPLQAEVLAWDLSDPAAEPLELTADDAQQEYPHVQDGRVVWTDFSADPDRRYVEGQSPSENNGDIVGFDLRTGDVFEVTRDPGKQLRPALYGDQVVWLDWRDIQPEPKFSRFWIYAASISGDGERRIAEGAFASPELQIRPNLTAEHLLWLGLRPTLEGTFEEGGHALLTAPLDGDGVQTGRLLRSGGYDAAVVRDGVVALVGDGRLEIAPLSALLEGGE